MTIEPGVVKVALVSLCVEQVTVVLIEGFVLAPPPGEVRVGQVVTAKAHQVCMIALDSLNGTLPVVPTCNAPRSSCSPNGPGQKYIPKWPTARWRFVTDHCQCTWLLMEMHEAHVHNSQTRLLLQIRRQQGGSALATAESGASSGCSI